MRKFLLTVFGIVTALISIPRGVESTTALADVSAGADLFQTSCAQCHGRAATGGRGPDLTRRAFRHATAPAALFQVIARGIPGSSMPGSLMLHSEPAVWQLVACVQSLHLGPEPSHADGDAAAGMHLIEEGGRCATCHLIDGRGGGA